MWLPLGLLLVPVVLGLESELRVNDYILSIDECHTLRSIQPTDRSTNQLDLSSLNIECLDKSVFNNVNSIKTLNLANNSLYGVPAFVFANLTSLEHLSLAGNKMMRFEKTFEGLGHLKTLNISDLPLKSLSKGYLHGLSKVTEVVMLNNKVTQMTTDVFEEGPDLDKPRSRTTRSACCEDSKVNGVTASNPNDTKIERNYPERQPHRVKVCIHDGVVKSAETLTLNPSESLPVDCRELQMEFFYPTLNLANMSIVSFEKNWFRVNATVTKIDALILDHNSITRVTSDLLNDLPWHVKLVSLVGNKIERLEAGVMANDHLAVLRLSKNFISVIEDSTFARMKLMSLELDDNRLKDTRFAATMPWTLYRLRLERNHINTINEGSFANFNTSTELFLAGNNVTSLQRDSLRGLGSLLRLDLTSNGLKDIEPGAFSHLKSIRTLQLPKNNISSLKSGLFEGVEAEFILNLASNKFTKVTRDTLPDLPVNLAQLYLDNNDIESLEAGAFVKLPTYNLALNGNRISKIARGSFDLPQLEILTLSGNALTSIDGDSFAGLTGLHALTISNNCITRLQKGSMSNLGHISFLDISDNPLKRLNNGDLFGLKKSPTTWITLSEGDVEVVQGGVFDDV